MNRKEFKEKLNSYSKEVLITYIIATANYRYDDVVDHLNTYKRDFDIRAKFKKEDELFEKFNKAIDEYNSYILELKEIHQLDKLSLKDLTSKEIEKLSKLATNKSNCYNAWVKETQKGNI